MALFIETDGGKLQNLYLLLSLNILVMLVKENHFCDN